MASTNCGSAVEAHGLEIHGLEQVEHLNQSHTAAAGGRHRQHRQAAEAVHRLNPRRAVGRQVLAIDQAAALLHQRFQLLSHRPLIKARAALLSDAPQGGRQQRLPQDLASAISSPPLL